MNKTTYHKNLIYLFLFLFSFLFNFYYGYRGVLPIDSFLIFDSGYFVLNGEYPFRDFWTITGPLLDYLQSIFFYIFDVSWFSYVLHASCLNFLLVSFSYFFFINLGLKKIYSLTYSIAVSVLAYPSIGTPFPDHHAFIFAIISMYFMIYGISREKYQNYFFVTLFLFFSFLSKQTSSFYLTVFFLLILLTNLILKKENRIKKISYFLSGAILPAILFLIFLKFTNTPLKNFLVQYIFYPSTIGGERISDLNLDFKNMVSQFKFIYLSIIPAIIIFFYNFIFKNKKKDNDSEIYIFTVFIGTVIIFLYSQLLTQNQILIFSLIPICAAYSHQFIKKYYDKNYLIYFIVLVLLFSTLKYHLRFNEDKKFMELEGIDINKFVNGVKIDDSLSNLKWITHHYPEDSQKEATLLRDSLNKIKLEKVNKIVITDYQFISSITKNKFSSPNKWHDAKSVPSKENEFYKDYQDFFFLKIKKNEIEKIYFVGQDKEFFFLELIENKSCIKESKANDLLKIYDISECSL